ncbi:MAG: alpha-2-macroglobulin [Chitinophagales bacterium]
MNMPVLKYLSLFALLFTLFINDVVGQQPVKNYEKEWKKVDDLVSKKLPKSALTEVKKIYVLAKKDRQDAQVIKSLVFMTSLQNENREANKDSSIHEIEKELLVNHEPAVSILNSLLAGLYWNYYNTIRWQLYNRTATVNFKKDDIATWSAEDFHKKITELFLRSLKDEKLLQQTKLDPFNAIILKGNVRHLRPTLYDLLAHRALSYFENDERDIKKPAYAFEIDQASAFDPAADFVTRKFVTNDSLSLQHKALLIYQKLIAFHLKDAKHDALIDADILRIQFVNSKSVHSEKDVLYFNAINHIAHQYGNLPAAAQAWFLVASYYEEKATTYKPYADTTHRFDRIKAKEICERVLTQKDTSEGMINCYNLLKEINRRALQFNIEKVNVPDQPFRVLINYRNFTQVYYRLIKADAKLKKDLENQPEEKYWPAIIAAKPVRTGEQSLPATHDMQQHTVEIKMDALPVGEYMLVASTDKDFAGKKAILGARLFYVSSISYVNNGYDFFVLNRDNGQPLAAASVQFWEQNYDYKTSRYIKTKGKLYKTDNNGFFRMEKRKVSNYSNAYFLDINYNKDQLFLDDQGGQYYQFDPESPAPPTKGEKQIDLDTYTWLFTDRSLYRPGQTVFFKGISIVSDKESKNYIRENYKTWVYLFNANYQKVDSLNVQTNEFGTFSGKFQLPQGVLNGQFTIQVNMNRGARAIQVEEYKRPKFSVDYDTLKETYKVKDKIKVTGFAKAYAGNNIDGATVKYRVVREARFLYPWLFGKWWLPRAEPMEITHGEVKTGKDGKFIIEFTAIPDLKIDKKFDPVFDYVVYADVTDINGETRSGEKRIPVSYKALKLDVIIPASLPVDSLTAISVRTENMNGQFIPANVTVTITKLKEEKRLIRNRFWERPDQFVMSKEEYIRYFPYDEYDNETDQQSWAKEQKVFEKTDSARNNGQWPIDNKQFETGFYVVEISTKDKNGEEVKDVKYIELYDEKSNKLNHPDYLWAKAPQPIEPGEKTSVELGTSADNLFVIHKLDKRIGNQAATGTYSFFKLDNEKRSFDFTATEADRGGYGVSYLFVKHNRVYQSNQTIVVPWTNKDLKVEYATFRDKTLPGSEEKWKIKLTGYKNEKVAAEMLASMYDASLDQFYPHSWYPPVVWTNYYNSTTWRGDQNFLMVVSHQKQIPYDIEEQKYFYKVYDELSSDYYDMPIKKDGTYYRRDRFFKIEGTQLRAITGKVSDLSLNSATPSIARELRAPADGNIVLKADSWGLSFNSNGTTEKPKEKPEATQIRKNFNETAFFFPDLRTDSSGAIEFSFTIPEALTKWKFQALAHTKDLAFGYSSKEIVTQKQLMVQPNAPRFMREGDKMEFSAKVVNLTEKEITGQAEFQLFDATTNQPVDGRFKNTVPNQFFTVAAGQSEAIKFPIEIPYQFNTALTWRIVAKASLSTRGEGQGEVSDGEENTLPVLTNRMLVTETLPLNMRSAGTKTFKFDKLINSVNSETLKHHALTVEYTSNPAWYAVQALPYLMEYPYECAEQTWNKYYANSLATMIANSSPRIKQIFEQWKTKDTSALLSNLQKNEELKSVLLEETPWVLQAKSEAEQKKNIALLFDMVKMSSELNGSYEKLKQMQSSNGGFVWFKGGPDDRYMTQYIITGIGHLKKLKALADGHDSRVKDILATAIPYLDRKIKEDYDNLIKYKTDLKKYVPGSTTVQYLYMRSFFPEYKVAVASQTAYNYFRTRCQQTWTSQSKYMQGMLVLALGRTGDISTPVAILKSLKETSITNEELGMYWKDVNRGWWWYEAPIERQSLLIEAFQEIGKDTKTVDDLKTWLLKNKQTNRWESTKATAEACYALLLQGTNWLSTEPTVQIQLGATRISSDDNKQEAGTGYFKKSIEGEKVNPQMGNISVTVGPVNQSPNQPITWGGVYWQYFEDLDKITTAATPLKLVKKLFIEKNTDRGPVLTPVNDGDALKVGDKIKVRIELRVDRDMEYVHMKDMRASAMEPVNVLSGYKWQDGLGYYETTKDASTNFFFGNLRKGTYVFEYPLFVTHTGNFSNGVTTIQCMYAPEFSSHSEGIRISVE